MVLSSLTSSKIVHDNLITLQGDQNTSMHLQVFVHPLDVINENNTQ
jgi:hypothetical protein